MNIRRTIVSIAAAAALAAPLSACSEQANTQPTAAPTSASQAVTEAPEVEATDDLHNFGSTATLPEDFGAEVTIKKTRAGATDTYGGIEEAQSVVIFEITQTNTSDQSITPANLLSATVDGVPAEETFGAVGENTGAPTTAIRPGGSVTWTAAYVGTMDQEWDVDLTVLPVDYDGDYSDPTNFHTVLFTEAR